MGSQLAAICSSLSVYARAFSAFQMGCSLDSLQSFAMIGLLIKCRSFNSGNFSHINICCIFLNLASFKIITTQMLMPTCVSGIFIEWQSQESVTLRTWISRVKLKSCESKFKFSKKLSQKWTWLICVVDNCYVLFPV